jgi:uncharacterized protein (DUF1697 family)
MARTGKVSCMSEYAAFLRGMNVGGHRLANAELKTHFEALGFSDVHTFRASGNVLFAAATEPVDTMAAHIEAGLAAALGYEVPVFLRNAGEIRKIAALEPFAKSLVEAAKGKLQVAMLSAKPAAKARKEVERMVSDEDRLAFGARELHWLPSGGILDSTLDFKAIEKLLGPMTVRTRGTVDQIVAKYFTA